MHDAANLLDVSFEESKRVWVGQHQARNVANSAKLAQTNASKKIATTDKGRQCACEFSGAAGGGVAAVLQPFFSDIKNRLPQWSVNSRCLEIPLVPAHYGANSGIAGGAALSC